MNLTILTKLGGILTKLTPWLPLVAVGAAVLLRPRDVSDAMASTEKQYRIGFKLGNLKKGQKFHFSGNEEVYEVQGLHPVIETTLAPVLRHFVLCRNRWNQLFGFSAQTRVRKARVWA